MKNLFLALTLALTASAASAQVQPCVNHKALVKDLAAQGSVRVMSGPNEDGRWLETYYNKARGLWSVVVVTRTDGRVTPTSCSILFGVGDPGVFIPRPPVTK